MSLTGLVNDKLKLSRSAPAAFVGVVEQTQQEAYNRVLRGLNMLERDAAGKIVLSSTNTAMINAIADDVARVFMDRDYQNALTQFVNEISTQAGNTLAIFETSLGNVPTANDLFAQVLRQTQLNALQIFSQSSIDAIYIQPLREQLFLSVTNGSSLRDTIKAVRGITLGGDGEEGLVYRYSKTWARTSFAQADANYSSTVANVMGAEFFKYAGDTIETTRPFCETRHEKYYHRKEVEAWGLLTPWAGQIKGTNPSTIFTNRGGWNCRHQLIAYSAIKVPKADVKRAIKKGYYKPSAEELKLLNL